MMNERIKELALQANPKNIFKEFDRDDIHFVEKFAELIVKECIQIASKQRNPSNLNYKPSEQFEADLRLHFSVWD